MKMCESFLKVVGLVGTITLLVVMTLTLLGG